MSLEKGLGKEDQKVKDEIKDDAFSQFIQRVNENPAYHPEQQKELRKAMTRLADIGTMISGTRGNLHAPDVSKEDINNAITITKRMILDWIGDIQDYRGYHLGGIEGLAKGINEKLSAVMKSMELSLDEYSDKVQASSDKRKLLRESKK